MGERDRYGDDEELTRAARAAALRVAVAFALTCAFVALSFLWLVLHVAGGAVVRVVVTFHGLPLIGLVVGAVCWIAWRLSRGATRTRLPRGMTDLPESHGAHQSLARLATLADTEPPLLVMVDSDVRNAFVLDVARRPVTICLTRAAVMECPPEQVEAMLAHELFHVAHGDTRLARRLEQLAELADDKAPTFVSDFVLGAVRGMLRQREHSADRAAALLTGRPSALVEALRACTDDTGRVDLRDLRDVAPVAFVGEASKGYPLPFDTHPTVAARVEVVARVAARLGHR